MNIADLREKRKSLMAEATQLQTAGDFTPETRSKFDGILAEVDTIDGDIKRAERTETEARATQVQAANRPVPGASEDRSAAEKRAFAAYMKLGVDKLSSEQRDLLTINANGSALIPQAFYPTLIQIQKQWGALYNVVDKFRSDSGAPMKVSIIDDTANVMAPVTEGTAVPELDPVGTSAIISTDELSSLVKVSLQELQDSAFDVDNFLRNAFGPRYYRGLTQYMTTGSSTGNITGIVGGLAGNQITSAATGSLGLIDLEAAYGAIDPAYVQNGTFAMNSNTRAKLMGLTDSLGRPLLQESATDGPFSTLFGRPIVIDQFLPNVATGNVPVIFADFQNAYLLREVNPGLSVVRLNERYMDTLEVGFIGMARVGGIVKTNKAAVEIVIK